MKPAAMKLFTVGPVEMDDETLYLGSQPLPYFRTSEFSELMFSAERILKQLVKTADSSKVAMLTGSGTAAMEAAVISTFTVADRLLIVNGGAFGARFVQICRIHHIYCEEIRLPFGESLREELFVPYAGKGFTGLLVNIHETSIGQLYPISVISAFCRANGLVLLVDAISSFLADEYKMDEWGIDVTVFSSQKSLALPPGLSFVVANEQSVLRMQKISPPTLYLKLNDYFENMVRGQTPYTPAVGIILQLHNKLLKISEMGLDSYLQKAEGLAKDCRAGILATSFTLPRYPLSNALTPILCPRGNAQEVYRTLKNDYSMVITPSGGDLANTLLRIGHMGNLTLEDNLHLLQALQNWEE